MVKKILPLSKLLYIYLSPFFVLFLSIEMNAQCSAGSDNNLDVCDISNISSQAIDLNAQLGIHDIGGLWKDDDNSAGLNINTGILNAQQIRQSAIYRYTYSVSDGLGCTDTAVITVTIGGYTGVPSKLSVCANDKNYDLFFAFEGVPYLLPQKGGQWTDDDNAGGLNGNILDTTIPLLLPDRYHYTYTIAAIGSCVAPPPVTVELSIYPPPYAGKSTEIFLCSDELSAYTNFDLNVPLIDEDSGGFWTESDTSEINGFTDSIIDLQNIYNTKGAGRYQFIYTARSKNTACPDATATIDITIEDTINLSGASLTIDSNICENAMATAMYRATLVGGTIPIPNGNYNVSYTITGIPLPIEQSATSINGKLVFVIPRSNFQSVRDYIIRIVGLEKEENVDNGFYCSNLIGGDATTVLTIYPIPKINNATLSIVEPICQKFGVTVELSSSQASDLPDGNYTILYNLRGSNTATAVSATLNVSGGTGNSSFTIPGNLLPNAGTTTIKITNITNTGTNCVNTSSLSKTFIINPIPNVSAMVIVVGNQCLGKPVNVQITGLGSLTSINVSYEISGSNTVSTQTIPLSVNSGNANFSIAATHFLNPGNNTLHLTDLTNNGNNCSAILNSVPEDFMITTSLSNPIASNPIASNPGFCKTDFVTIANLVPNGNQYRWLNSPTSTTPLGSTVLLTTATYYVKEVDVISGCESALTTVNVIVNEVPTPVAADQGFCKTALATIADLVPNGNQYIWVNSPGSSTPLNSTVLLTNSNYYVKGVDALSGCKSVATPVIITVKEMVAPVAENQKFCKTDFATIANLVPKGTQYKWFETPTSSLPLDVNVPLTASIYYVKEVDANLACESVLTAVEVSVKEVGTPVANDQNFCKTDLTTIASLVPNGNQYKWVNSPNSTIPLNPSELLVTSNYYVKEVDLNTGCESVAAQVNVVVNEVPTPNLNPRGQEFCGVDRPTIQNLSNNTISEEVLIWYDAAINGTPLVKTDLLKEGFTYYGFDYSETTKCYSTALAVTVSLTDCTATPENFIITDGFSPNGDGVNDTFQIKDIEFLYPNYTLEIFNRYGNILFKGDINKPDWDGKNLNSNLIDGDAPSGVYFYIINYNKDNLPPKQGKLYLNR